MMIAGWNGDPLILQLPLQPKGSAGTIRVQNWVIWFGCAYIRPWNVTQSLPPPIRDVQRW